MPAIGVVAILILVNWWSFRTLSRLRARRRRAPLTSRAGNSAGQPTTPPAPNATDNAVSAPEPSARAFPVQGLPPGRDSARALEGILRRMGGVTRAYVSPVTALAYVDYLPAQVTEEQLALAIQDGGYRVGDAAQRFDWRHAQKG